VEAAEGQEEDRQLLGEEVVVAGQEGQLRYLVEVVVEVLQGHWSCQLEGAVGVEEDGHLGRQVEEVVGEDHQWTLDGLVQRFVAKEVAVVRSLLSEEVAQDERSWEAAVELLLRARLASSAAEEVRRR
jgi:hypothetical protein